MSSLAVHGVPIPPEEIHAALRSAAVPGFTGVLQLTLSVKQEAVKHVVIDVVRRQSMLTHTREQIPAVGPHFRKDSVLSAIEQIRDKLLLRTVLISLEAHYVDGELKKVTITE